jgi:uncharacterized protein (DUF2267 family)
MDELVKLVSQNTGLSEDMSRQAVQVVVNYLKDRLPAPAAAQADAILSGGSDLGNLAKGLGGMLGKK